jgi:formylglycine-generating enzyme required for sulfatase activity
LKSFKSLFRVVPVLVLFHWSTSCTPDPGADKPFSIWREPVTGSEFVRLPAGRFRMGSGPEEPGSVAEAADETPHEVVLSHGFWIGRTEVTQEQWQEVMGSNPSQFPSCGPKCPVETVSYDDIQQFLARLERRSPGSRFRLPTEAEWEYACRAGTTTPFSTGRNLTTAQANYDGRYPYQGFPRGRFPGHPVPVASYPPNPWGLYDMHGNVWEWCEDWYGPYPQGQVTDPRGAVAGARRVIRGGSWYFNADSSRCALRYTHAPSDSGFSLGFRLVRETAPETR